METNPRLFTTCFHCNATYDPVRSKWCDCLSRTRSLVCTKCEACSCDAPPHWANVYGIRMPRPEPKARTYQGSEESVARPIALVAEDQRIVRTIICQALASRFDIVIAETGSKALQLAREIHPTIVITDALMPGLDGRELSRLLKSDPKTADIPVILVTGLYRSVLQANEAVLVFKVDAVLTKPVSAKTLLETVDDVLTTERPGIGITGAESAGPLALA